MTTRTHFHFLTHLRTVVVLSAIITTHSASAMLTPNQQDNPPLAHPKVVMKNAKKFLKQINKSHSAGTLLDKTDADFYTLLVGGGSSILSAVAWFVECTGYCSPEVNLTYIMAPAIIWLTTYLILPLCTTSHSYQQAALAAARVIKILKNDGFFNGSIADQEIEGYVMVKFGTSQGALNAIENYRNLYKQLESIDILLEHASQTQDEELSQQCDELQTIVSSLSTQLVKKIAILSDRMKNTIKEQLHQKYKNEKIAHKAVQQERDLLKQEQQKLIQALDQERDRAAAIQNGTISYQRTVGEK